MPTLAIIGMQWGDEGKGKIADYLAERADIVVRFQGGTNAGHTIALDNEVFKLHLLPSGIIRPNTLSVIGNGVVVDLEELVEEMKIIEGTGRSLDGLRISDRAHIIMPYHKLLDRVEEAHRGKKGVGTTGRGIGPSYSDKIARHGIRICDLFDREALAEKLEIVLPVKEKVLTAYEESYLFPRNEIFENLVGYGKYIEKYVTDTSNLIIEAIADKKKVLFEGAQGTMLDIDHGTYPYVTSSNCISGAICTGAGVPPSSIQEILGVVKAYTTRVGSGPFPTELNDETASFLLQRGGEFGTTTGRPRRCGWLDLVVVNYAARLNGITSIAVTKIDVLSGLKKIKVAVAYEIDGEITTNFPSSIAKIKKAKPIYKEFDGWDEWVRDERESIAKRGFDALPNEMKDYLNFISNFTGVPISIISIGPRRNETIDRRVLAWSRN
ncbi:MAG: adenylosuccinate synthase [Methanomassiliicoccales archaeon]